MGSASKNVWTELGAKPVEKGNKIYQIKVWGKLNMNSSQVRSQKFY